MSVLSPFLNFFAYSYFESAMSIVRANTTASYRFPDSVELYRSISILMRRALAHVACQRGATVGYKIVRWNMTNG